MTDIHALDQYIGRHVRVTDRNGEGGSGWVVDVEDSLDYIDRKPTRFIGFDWGGGWRIGENTVIEEVEPREGDDPGFIEGPIQAMHGAMHEADDTVCIGPECPHGSRSATALRAFRIWRMKRSDAYWRNEYVNRAYAFSGDPVSTGQILRKATEEGAPSYVLDMLKAIAERAQGGKS